MKEGIDVKTVVFLLIQFCSGVWFFSGMNARLVALESRDSPPRSEYAVRDRAISETLAELKASQQRIEEKIDKLGGSK